jgi:integrase
LCLRGGLGWRSSRGGYARGAKDLIGTLGEDVGQWNAQSVRNFLLERARGTAKTQKLITSLRISEALNLLISDITPNGLLIRRTKFQKTRLVPLHETAVAGLGHYLTRRQEIHRGGDHVFVSEEGQPLKCLTGGRRHCVPTAGNAPIPAGANVPIDNIHPGRKQPL